VSDAASDRTGDARAVQMPSTGTRCERNLRAAVRCQSRRSKTGTHMVRPCEASILGEFELDLVVHHLPCRRSGLPRISVASNCSGRSAVRLPDGRPDRLIDADDAGSPRPSATSRRYSPLRRSGRGRGHRTHLETNRTSSRSSPPCGSAQTPPRAPDPGSPAARWRPS